MIRQAISCDICGTDKQQTNHWFVAYDHHGELRIADWASQSRLRAGVKHLCGQTCLHKLVDEFIAKTISTRPSVTEKPAAAKKPVKLTAKTSAASRMAASWGAETAAAQPLSPRPVPVLADPHIADHIDEFESSARLIPAPVETPIEAPPAYNSRTWRSGAWKREQERAQRSAGRSIA